MALLSATDTSHMLSMRWGAHRSMQSCSGVSAVVTSKIPT